jgi:hypothetical protein
MAWAWLVGAEQKGGSGMSVLEVAVEEINPLRFDGDAGIWIVGGLKW